VTTKLAVLATHPVLLAEFSPNHVEESWCKRVSRMVSMSFLRHRQTHLSDLRVVGATLAGAPTLIVAMSLQLAIPRWVALQQSPPPLHQPRENLVERTGVVQRIVSGTFLREATNRRSGPFLREATGRAEAEKFGFARVRIRRCHSSLARMAGGRFTSSVCRSRHRANSNP
jgi:hypothetical protein